MHGFPPSRRNAKTWKCRNKFSLQDIYGQTEEGGKREEEKYKEKGPPADFPLFSREKILFLKKGKKIP